MPTQKEFSKMNTNKRYETVRGEGAFVASRLWEGFHIHLYALSGYHVEVWYRLGLNVIASIDIQSNQKVLNEYLRNIDLKKDLGLDE